MGRVQRGMFPLESQQEPKMYTFSFLVKNGKQPASVTQAVKSEAAERKPSGCSQTPGLLCQRSQSESVLKVVALEWSPALSPPEFNPLLEGLHSAYAEHVYWDHCVFFFGKMCPELLIQWPKLLAHSWGPIKVPTHPDWAHPSAPPLRAVPAASLGTHGDPITKTS